MNILQKFFSLFLGTRSVSEAQARFMREEAAALEWEASYDQKGKSQDNLSNVYNHELLLSILDKYDVTRQGFLNGYFRATGKVPYYFSEDDFIGEE